MKVTADRPDITPIIIPASSSLKSFNFYLIKINHTLLLIDAGVDTQACWDEFNLILAENGWQIADIDKIILTHNHSDHTGLVNHIRAQEDIPVYAHPKALIRLKRDDAFMSLRLTFFRNLYAKMDCGVLGEQQVEKLKQSVTKNKGQALKGDIFTISEGDMIDGLQVIETPGHAPDHIVLFHPRQQILFGGDHLIKHISSNAIVEPDQQGQRIPSLIQYEQSLQKCWTLPITKVYSGHGDVINHPNALIVKRLDRIEKKSKKIMDIIRNEPHTAAQIAKIYYRNKFEQAFPLVMSEIIGHLDRLVALHKVSVKLKEDILYYRLS